MELNPDTNAPPAPADDASASPENPREEQLIRELLAVLSEQGRPQTDLDSVQRAFEYGGRMHAGQYRKNQENYIVHPVSVATILAKIPVDTPTVVAAILHDVLEDTQATALEMKTMFGEEVLKLVEGVTKLGKFEFASKEDAQAENFRKMFLAMADDVRVIMLKLCDRLHNMQTLCYMKPEKQLKTASETLEIFAPLANRMGMGKIRAELEDLSLKHLDPARYEEIETEIAHTRDERTETITRVIEKIQDHLSRLDIDAKIYGRVKNIYSIYKKMQVHQKKVQEVYDISAVRIIVHSEKECYEVLGVIHNALTPIPGRFKDYIAMPKSNLYQSLHTTVIGPYGRPLEVQIRTQDMHRIAEYGIAAHWKYKETGGASSAEAFQASDADAKMAWLKQMVEMKEEAGNAREYVDSVKLDLFRDEVFVFTPKGRVVVLPHGATPVDFAYRIHTEVGNTCVGSKVNGRIVPLSYALKNGDIVDVMTSKKSSPRLDWIAFVQTQQAKTRIRQWYKKHYRERHEDQGRKLLEVELTRAGMDDAMRSGRLQKVAEELNYTAVDDLLVALGYGEINLARITNRLRKEEAGPANPDEPDPMLHRFAGRNRAETLDIEDISGLQGMMHQLAKCCNPLPGEPILGIVTRSRGVMIHRDDCVNLSHANPQRRMRVAWQGQKAAMRSVQLDIRVIDRMGVLKDILTKIADCNTNIVNTKVQIFDDQSASVEVTLEVESLQQLERVREAIYGVNDVLSVHRVQSRTQKRPS